MDNSLTLLCRGSVEGPAGSWPFLSRSWPGLSSVRWPWPANEGRACMQSVKKRRRSTLHVVASAALGPTWAGERSRDAHTHTRARAHTHDRTPHTHAHTNTGGPARPRQRWTSASVSRRRRPLCIVITGGGDSGGPLSTPRRIRDGRRAHPARIRRRRHSPVGGARPVSCAALRDGERQSRAFQCMAYDHYDGDRTNAQDGTRNIHARVNAHTHAHTYKMATQREQKKKKIQIQIK